jgi:ATP-dependent DNA helicase RecG
MTATPIPRSLALILYGDLDLSVLDQMPPGRKPTRTVVRTEGDRPEVYAAIRRELENGRQAFVVCPLIEESEKLDLRAASEMAEHLQKDIFPDYRVGLIHGRLKADERDTLMRRFQEGGLHILVSTTVIEVGIDIPNATLMVIEHAERLGLSQLHQLRGRISRGAHPGVCILLTEGAHSREAYQRIDVMRRSSDGFKIAEKDLEIRGPGEFVGTRQSGLPEFLFGNIVRDRRLLELACGEAECFLREHLKIDSRPAPEVLLEFAEWWKKHYGLYSVG